MIDICIVTCLRPEVLQKTLQSFVINVKNDNIKNIIINVDPVPTNPTLSIESMEEERHKSFLVGHAIGKLSQYYRCDNINVNTAVSGNFAKAVKTVWSNSTADYVFHLEDDWELLRHIDLDKCIEKMEKESFDYMRFPKVRAPHLNCLHKVALQPSLWKGEVVRNLAKHMTTDKDPEKQLRTGQGNEELDKILIELQNKGLKDYCSEWCCEDIGREWRAERGLVKWNKNKDNKNITWISE